MDKLTGYELSRQWFDFAFSNPELINPSHAAVYFCASEHQNRLGGKTKFGFPTTMVMEAVGIKSYNTYIKVFNDLVNWGFFELIEKSRNQYSANIIALSKNDKALGKALDKAFIKHASKQSESTDESISSIDKQINKEPIKPLINKEEDFIKSIHPFIETYGKEMLNDFFLYWSEKNDNGKKMRFEYSKNQPFNISRRLVTWKKNQKNFNNTPSTPENKENDLKQTLLRAAQKASQELKNEGIC